MIFKINNFLLFPYWFKFNGDYYNIDARKSNLYDWEEGDGFLITLGLIIDEYHPEKKVTEFLKYMSKKENS